MIKSIKTYFYLLRVDNYIKNLFVFAPLFFDFQFDITTIINALIAFILFCALASGVYIYNDIFDIESDQKHPVKKHRPIPSGAISIGEAKIIGIIMLLVSIITAFIIDVFLFYTFLLYLIINLLYNVILKKIPIVDVTIISFGFLLRILAGSYATHIPASEWILLMTFLLSLFLGFTKRRADVVMVAKNGIEIPNVRIFSIGVIDKIIGTLSVIMSIAYVFYTLSNEVIDRIGSPYVFVTTLWVLAGIIRYLRIVWFSDQYKDPTAIIIKDHVLQIIIVLWVLTFIALKYS